MTLKELFASLDTVTVTLGGTAFAARRVTGIEQDLITRIYPRPEAPLAPDAHRGSKAPMVPDLADPVYKASEEGWFADYVMSVVAAGLGATAIGVEPARPAITVDNHRDATVRSQAEAFLREARPVVQRVAWNHLLSAFNAIVRGDQESSGLEAAAKN